MFELTPSVVLLMRRPHADSFFPFAFVSKICSLRCKR